jgi:hypothetical protein
VAFRATQLRLVKEDRPADRVALCAGRSRQRRGIFLEQPGLEHLSRRAAGTENQADEHQGNETR